MVRVSNGLVGLLNLVIFLLSIPILGAGIWLSHRVSTDCEKFLEKPMIALGVFLLVVSLAGLIGAWCRVSWLLWIYLLVMFVLIVLLFCFTIFAFVVTNKGAGRVVSGRGYKEYRLGDYSNWLQKRVENQKNWRKIMSCLLDSNVCQSLAGYGFNEQASEFYNKYLSPIQSGCCKPPSSCNFQYVTPINWTRTDNSSLTYADCTTWSNDPNTLCYRCNSCKAGVLANLKNDWKKVAIVNIIFLIIAYSVGCCAFRNNREDNSYPRYKGYP